MSPWPGHLVRMGLASGEYRVGSPCLPELPTGVPTGLALMSGQLMFLASSSEPHGPSAATYPSVRWLLPGGGWARGKSGPVGIFQGARKQIPAPHRPRRPISSGRPPRPPPFCSTLAHVVDVNFRSYLDHPPCDQGVLRSP